jgi:hypothetical protein
MEIGGDEGKNRGAEVNKIFQQSTRAGGSGNGRHWDGDGSALMVVQSMAVFDGGMDNGSSEQGCLIAVTEFDSVQWRWQGDISKDGV